MFELLLVFELVPPPDKKLAKFSKFPILKPDDFVVVFVVPKPAKSPNPARPAKLAKSAKLKFNAGVVDTKLKAGFRVVAPKPLRPAKLAKSAKLKLGPVTPAFSTTGRFTRAKMKKKLSTYL